MTTKFNQPAVKHRFTLKCIPQNTARQEITGVEIKINNSDEFTYSSDSFGNKMIYGCISQPHKCFCVALTAQAETGLEIYESTVSCTQNTSVFKYPTVLTAPKEKLREYYISLDLNGLNTNYDKALYIMHRLNSDFSYAKDKTGINTTAEEAFKLGCGVCQDYAHIMLALCRMAEIPSRYVAGAMTGEGFSHAWVEILSNGFWYGMDSTNNLLVNENYIKISHGRDYRDCVINKGIFNGAFSQSMDIKLSIEQCQ